MSDKKKTKLTNEELNLLPLEQKRKLCMKEKNQI